MHDLVDPSWRNVDVLGQAILADLHGREEVLLQDLPRVDGGKALRHLDPLVIVNDFNLIRVVPHPPEADPPSTVHSDAVLTCTPTSEPLEMIARRHTQIFGVHGGIEYSQLSQCDSLDVQREPLNRTTFKNQPSAWIAKTLDHAR